VYSHYKSKKEIRENTATEILGVEDQKIDEGDLIIEKTPEVDVNGVYQVSIPYYWKTGVNIESDDVLEGYIPNIKDFREYFNTKRSILFGSSDRDTEGFVKEGIVLSRGNYIYSNGIENASTYFEWDEDHCSTIFFTEVESNIFICENWVNWLGNKLSEKTFVLTRCNINSIDGYCVFEDYLKTYYDLRTTAETRCFDQDESQYLCEYEDYINLIEFN
jgi:hypothetical protein